MISENGGMSLSMYGYIVVDQPELKFREFDKYRSYYCGLCDSLAEAHGLKGRFP